MVIPCCLLRGHNSSPERDGERDCNNKKENDESKEAELSRRDSNNIRLQWYLTIFHSAQNAVCPCPENCVFNWKIPLRLHRQTLSWPIDCVYNVIVQ